MRTAIRPTIPNDELYEILEEAYIDGGKKTINEVATILNDNKKLKDMLRWSSAIRSAGNGEKEGTLIPVEDRSLAGITPSGHMLIVPELKPLRRLQQKGFIKSDGDSLAVSQEALDAINSITAVLG